MSAVHRRLGRLVLATAVWAAPAIALASEEGHGHGGIPWMVLLFTTINFLIFCWIIAHYAGPVIHDYVRGRHDRIVAELEAAAQARAEAQQLKAQWEERLAALDKEIQQIRAQAAADAARERDAILAAAMKTAESIRNDARRTAAQEVRQAETTLRQAVAQQATAIATQLVRDRLTAADQDRFVSEFLGQVREAGR
jgi:F-type H+-transporting ATPase subunit b